MFSYTKKCKTVKKFVGGVTSISAVNFSYGGSSTLSGKHFATWGHFRQFSSTKISNKSHFSPTNSWKRYTTQKQNSLILRFFKHRFCEIMGLKNLENICRAKIDQPPQKFSSFSGSVFSPIRYDAFHAKYTTLAPKHTWKGIGSSYQGQRTSNVWNHCIDALTDVDIWRPLSLVNLHTILLWR